MKNSKSYEHYTVYEFVMDDTFKKAVKNPGSQEDLFWRTYYEDHPEKRGMMDEARGIISSVNLYNDYLPESQVRELLGELNARIEQSRQPAEMRIARPERRHRSLIPWQRIAAVSIGVLLVASAVVFLTTLSRPIVYATRYGETRTIILPDGSQVILNANSRLEHHRNLDNKPVREVRLEGEAFFSVVHTEDDKKFYVNTSDLNVEVLGTEFNVNSRRGATKVVLNSGKVRLSLGSLPDGHAVNDAQSDSRTGGFEIIMKPGELVEYSKKTKKITKEEVNPERLTAWKDNKLVFKDTPISEIVKILEDNYGFEVVIDSALTNRKFTASYSTDDIEIILKALSRSFNVNVTKTGNRILFESTHE